MSILRAQCPSCNAALKITNLSLAGKTAKCPKCAKPVALPSMEPDEPSDTESARGAGSRPDIRERKAIQSPDDDQDSAEREDRKAKQRRNQRRKDDDDDAVRDRDRDDRRSRTKKGKPERKRPLALIIGVAALLLVGGGIAAFFITRDKPMRGEPEIKELIKAKEAADKETDQAKKLEAQIKVLAVMLAIENLKLTEEEQKKLLAKYKPKLDELKLGMEASWAMQNKGRQDEQAKKEERKNRQVATDTPSLIQALQEIDRNSKVPECTALLKQVEQNIPVNSPRRLDVLKAIRRAASQTKLFPGTGQMQHDIATEFVRSALRYAVKEDINELMGMFREHDGNATVKDLLTDRFAEWKDLAYADRLQSEFGNFIAANRRRAAKVFRAIGAPAETIALRYVGRDPQAKGDTAREDAMRFEVIELLGEIGTQESVTRFKQLQGESPQVQKWIDDAVKKIRERHKLP